MTPPPQRPTAKMPAPSRSSRFQNLGMANNSDNIPPPLNSNRTNAAWQGSGIWGNGGIASLGQNDTGGSRGSSADEAFQNGASTFGRLPAASDPAPWGPRPSAAWNTTDSPRNISGDTSPNRTRDSAAHDLSSSSQYYQPAQYQGPIGQRGTMSARGRHSTSLDSSAGGFDYDPFQDHEEEEGDVEVGAEENGHNLAPAQFTGETPLRGLGPDRRGSQENGYLGLASGPSREPSLPPPNPSESDRRAQGNFYMNFNYPSPSTAPSHSHSKRPSLAGLTSTFPNQSASSIAFIPHPSEEEQLQQNFSRGLSLRDSSSGPQNGLGNSPMYPGSAAPSFRFDPGSQSWDNGRGHANHVLSSDEAYPNSYAGPYANPRPARQHRDPPSTEDYVRTIQAISSLRGAAHQNADPWSRPSSRDPSFNPEMERRGQIPSLMPQTLPFYPQTFFNSNYPHQLAANPLDHYNPALAPQPDFRPTAPPFAGYGGLSMHPYLSPTASLSMRASRDQDPAKGVRSPLLEEFRSSSKSNKRYELKDMYGHFVEFSGDQHGSRFIQQKLETANSDEKEQVFKEIEPNAIQLMKDVFGNYVIQKFFEHGNQIQKKVLASVMKGKIVDLSTQMYACRVVQKALEHVLVEQQAELVAELEPEVLRVVKDQNGNHVIQKVVELVPRKYIGFVTDCFRGKVSDLSSQSYGCRVIQRVLEYGTDDDKAMVMDEIHASAQYLITDQYGNYVAQHVIQHGKEKDRKKMIAVVINQLLPLSKHKFASNVVEKCIEFGSPEQCRHIRKQFTTLGPDGSNPLQPIMKDQYGNYVIQTLLNNLEGADRASFIDEMKPLLSSLKKLSTGRHISAIDRLITAVESPAPTKNGTPASTEPASPSLQVDASSAAQTPNLTMEPNSPSSSPPSTNASAVGDAMGGADKTDEADAVQQYDVADCPEVRIDEV